MEVKIPKEIREYQEAIFFGLSARQFICSIAAAGVAVLVYLLFHQAAGVETVSWICMLCAAPFAAVGFFRYNGMTAEQFAWAWLMSELIMPKRLIFKAENIYCAALKRLLSEGDRK